MKRPLKVVAIIDFSSQSARDFATGLFAWIRTHGGWMLQTLPNDASISKAAFARMEGDGVAGAIMLRDLPPELEEIVAESKMKIVSATLGQTALKRRKRDITYTLVDDEGLGRSAAKLLMGLGKFRTYAFVPAGRVAYSLLREKGFRAALRANGIAATAFSRPEQGFGEDVRGNLRKWLVSLPRPAALFVANDHHARLVADICAECAIPVPTGISIVGVDNDEFYCLSNAPRLSSLCPDHVGLGESAGREMEKLLRARTPQPVRHVLTRGHMFFDRESTRAKTTGYNLAVDAADYIRRHAHLGITPETVARHLGVSRRLLDMRFRQVDGRSINEAIIETRMERAKRMLAESDMPISEIANTCAFRHVSYFTRLFKLRHGSSPAAWRKSHR